MTDWKKTYSSAKTKPSELDTTTSSFVVYERRDIHQETYHDETSDTDIAQWVYDERTMTKNEYSQLSSPVTQLVMQNLSDIEADILDLVVQEG